MRHMLAPPTPVAGESKLYFKTDGLPYCKDPAGIERALVESVAAIHANPGFEGTWANQNNSNGVPFFCPPDWYIFWSNDTATMSQETSQITEGQYAVKGTIGATAAGFRIENAAAFSCQAGDVVSFEVDAKATAAGNLAVELYTSAGPTPPQLFDAATTVQGRNVPISTGYQRVRVSWTVPSGHLLGKFSLFWNKVSSSVYLDNTRSTVTTGGGTGNVITGEIKMWPTASAPSGYLLCDGTVYNITDYPILGPLLGSVFGGNGTTTFGTPDLIRRVAVGAGGGISVGRNDGITPPNTRTFAHNHSATNVNHTGTANTSTGGSGTRVNTIAGTNDGQHTHGITTVSFDSTPSMCLNFIIKT
jgi:microcystin-dependent protein